MLLESIEYTRLKGKSKEWCIKGRDDKPVHFGNFNLIVGKNSAGKSQTLAVIREIAGLFSGCQHLSEVRYVSAKYRLSYKDGSDAYQYTLEYENKTVVHESLLLNGQEKINRANKQLYSEELGSWEQADISDNNIFVSLYNTKKYPYLEKLYIWGSSLRNSFFSNQLQKNYLVDNPAVLEMVSPEELKDSALLLYHFNQGITLFGEIFEKRIIDDMKVIGYFISAISIQKTAYGYALCVQESDQEDITDQLDMSQGMFRALSFLIYLNFAVLNKVSVCVLIDDLGEGIDFNRSGILMDFLIRAIDKSGMQIFITTNDRYIMNKLPLDYWSVVERHPKESVFFNYHNSKDIFDDFKYTGLSNFDFLATDFYIRGFNEDEEYKEE